MFTVLPGKGMEERTKHMRVFQKLMATWLPRLYICNQVGNYMGNTDDSIVKHTYHLELGREMMWSSK